MPEISQSDSVTTQSTFSSTDHIYVIMPSELFICLEILTFTFLQNALVVPHAYNWTFTIRPNDIREDRLSRDITENVHSLVSRRYQ